MALLIEFGGLAFTLILFAKWISKSGAATAFDKALVKRSYQVQLMDDQFITNLMSPEDQPEAPGKLSLVTGLFKQLVGRQRLPTNKEGKALTKSRFEKLLAKGKERLRVDLDIVNQVKNTQKIKALTKILLNDQQQMLLDLNKRTLLTIEDSQEDWSESPSDSDGEDVTVKIQKSQQYSTTLRKSKIDADKISRRALLGIISRKFTDEQVSEEIWNREKSKVVRQIADGAYGDTNYGRQVAIQARQYAKLLDRSETRNIEMENTGPIPHMDSESGKDAEFEYRDEESGAGRKKKVRVRKVTRKQQPADNNNS